MLRLRPLRRPIDWVMLVTLVIPALALGLSRAAAQALGYAAPWSMVSAASAAAADRSINATDSEDALKNLPSLVVRKRYIGD